ncbi:hypothetical protein Tco_0926787 [Tanacetum coccineum]|uniref:Uncharacterized protein n=1 Tax=Tanacetum coccineum TaxID=301880 RepID=A0ABQ5DBM2_9ASTR
MQIRNFRDIIHSIPKFLFILSFIKVHADKEIKDRIEIIYKAYIPSAEADFNSAVRDLRDLNFPLLQELSNKQNASTWDIMDLLRLDDAVAEALGMTDLQPDISQLIGSCYQVFITVVIVPHSGPSVSVEDYDNPDLVDVVPKNVTPGPEGEEKTDASTGGDLAFSKLDDEAKDDVL